MVFNFKQMELVRHNDKIASVLVVARLVLLRRQALAAMLCAKDERVINNVRLRAGPDWNA